MQMETKSITENDWISELINKLENIILSGGEVSWTDNVGNTVTAVVTDTIVSMLRENYAHLMLISINAFKNFMSLMYQQRDFEALVVIYEELDTSELVNRYKEDTIKLAEIARQAQEERDFWVSFGKEFGTRLLFGAISVLL
jgi:DNA-binding LacI/PurR family transcriptional regulator